MAATKGTVWVVCLAGCSVVLSAMKMAARLVATMVACLADV